MTLSGLILSKPKKKARINVLIPLLVDDPLRGSLFLCPYINPTVLIPLLVDDPLRVREEASFRQ